MSERLMLCERASAANKPFVYCETNFGWEVADTTSLPTLVGGFYFLPRTKRQAGSRPRLLFQSRVHSCRAKVLGCYRDTGGFTYNRSAFTAWTKEKRGYLYRPQERGISGVPAAAQASLAHLWSARWTRRVRSNRTLCDRTQRMLATRFCGVTGYSAHCIGSSVGRAASNTEASIPQVGQAVYSGVRESQILALPACNQVLEAHATTPLPERGRFHFSLSHGELTPAPEGE